MNFKYQVWVTSNGDVSTSTAFFPCRSPQGDKNDVDNKILPLNATTATRKKGQTHNIQMNKQTKCTKSCYDNCLRSF